MTLRSSKMQQTGACQRQGTVFLSGRVSATIRGSVSIRVPATSRVSATCRVPGTCRRRTSGWRSADERRCSTDRLRVAARRHAAALVLSTGLLLWVAGCGGGEDGTVSPPRDVDAPAAVSDLAATGGSAGAVTLTWTAPGDDWDQGSARTYDLRYQNFSGSSTGWDTWIPVAAPPAPQPAGTTETFTVTSLIPDQVYVFKLKTADELSNWSGESNPAVATAAEQFDTTPPAAVINLASHGSTRTRITLTWTASGDDGSVGTATAYDLRLATEPITPGSWDEAAPVALSSPFSAGSSEEFTVTGLVKDTGYYFALKVGDEAGNWSALSNVLPAATNLTWYVTPSGDGDAPTIRSACVDSATQGDEILVAPGRYTWTSQGDAHPNYGMIYFPRDSTGFVLRSEAGPTSTILDAEGRGRVFFIQGISPGSTSNVTIEGFTITGGNSNQPAREDSSGAGLIAHLCSPTIRNCIFEDNAATYLGGGLWYGGRGSPTIENCVFRNNRADLGAGIMILNSLLPVIITDCEIHHNLATEAGGGIFASNIAFELENTAIYANTAGQVGGGLSCLAIHPSTVTGCTIVENSALAGGGVRLRGVDAQLTINRSILAFAELGGAISVFEDPDLSVRCSDLYGNNGGDALPPGSSLGGVFQLDPDFCGSPDTYDFDLQTDSPCAPGHHPGGMDCGLIGAFPVGCDRSKSR